ncbi:MAG: hypothetical protein M3O62_15330 [Pseudomonadota bacterium]|nr:hypothetical protein [Pseudomonadota bacterium]
MSTEQLASAYADAVVDHLEFGIDQGVVFKDGQYLLAGRRECEITPHLWVDRHWKKLVPEIGISTDPRQSDFNEPLLRAQIIESLARATELSSGWRQRAREISLVSSEIQVRQ